MTPTLSRSKHRSFGFSAGRGERVAWPAGGAPAQGGGGAPAIFDPAALFAGGEQGGWYAPSDLSTLFQDDQGLTPVTSDGDPVGLMQDLSGNGADMKQADPARRPIWRTDGVAAWLEYDGANSMIKTDADYVVRTGWTLASGWELASGPSGSGLSAALTLGASGVNYLSVGQRQSPPFASFGDRLNSFGVDSGSGGNGSMPQDTAAVVIAEWSDAAPFTSRMFVDGGEVASFDAVKLPQGQFANAAFGAMATPGTAATQLRRTFDMFFIDRVLTEAERGDLNAQMMNAAGIS